MVFDGTEVPGVWGEELVLPCRYSPGPLANDPSNFYQHTWISILDNQPVPVASNSNFHDNDNDFSLTIIKLNPILATYHYQCGIQFLVNGNQLQPYFLRDSPMDVDPINVVINEMNG